MAKPPGWLLELAGLAYLVAVAVAVLAIVMYARAMLVLEKRPGWVRMRTGPIASFAGQRWETVQLPRNTLAQSA